MDLEMQMISWLMVALINKAFKHLQEGKAFQKFRQEKRKC